MMHLAASVRSDLRHADMLTSLGHGAELSTSRGHCRSHDSTLTTTLTYLHNIRATTGTSRDQERGELDELIGYLQAREPWIPNYRQRRIGRKYIGSAHVEKANDLIVARRQKNRGMQWSEATSDALAALRTLMLNGGWDRYWQQREVLPLLAA